MCKNFYSVPPITVQIETHLKKKEPKCQQNAQHNTKQKHFNQYASSVVLTGINCMHHTVRLYKIVEICTGQDTPKM